MSEVQTSRILGWASLGIALAELAGTSYVEEMLGVEGHEALIRTFGVREAVAGLTILGQPGVNAGLAAGLWSRVAGDALDLAALAAAAPKTTNPKGFATAAAMVAGITVLDVFCAAAVQRRLRESNEALERDRYTPNAGALPADTAAASADAAAEPIPAPQGA